MRKREKPNLKVISGGTPTGITHYTGGEIGLRNMFTHFAALMKKRKKSQAEFRRMAELNQYFREIGIHHPTSHTFYLNESQRIEKFDEAKRARVEAHTDLFDEVEKKARARRSI